MKRKLLRISAEFLLDCLKHPIPATVSEGLPDDARITYVAWDGLNNMILLAIDSNSFPEVSSDGQLPEIELNFRYAIGG